MLLSLCARVSIKTQHCISVCMCAQAVVPDMLRPAAPPVGGLPASPTSAQHHRQYHSGQYGLGDDTDEEDELQHAEAATDSGAGFAQTDVQVCVRLCGSTRLCKSAGGRHIGNTCMLACAKNRALVMV